MNRKQTEQEKAKECLKDALNRIEIYDCCTARKEAEQILRQHPRLLEEYKFLIGEYRLN